MSIRLGEAPSPARMPSPSAAAARPPAPKLTDRREWDVSVPSARRLAHDQEPSPFARVLHGIGREIAHGESVVRGALNAGGNLGAGELLALQAGVYRYSEAVDLAAKLVDRASSGIKTVIQGQ